MAGDVLKILVDPDGATGRVFTDLAEAMAFGKAEGQIAIFDLDQMKEVRL